MDHIKRRARGAKPRIEDGKHSRLANHVLHSMDLAIEERIENGLGRAGAKIVPFEIKSINGMKLILRPRMKFFKISLASFSAFAKLATAGRNDAKS